MEAYFSVRPPRQARQTPYGSKIGLGTSSRERWEILLLSNRDADFLPEMGSVVGNDDQLGLALAEGLQGLLVAQAVLAGLHDQSQTSIDALQSLFLWEAKARWKTEG